MPWMFTASETILVVGGILTSLTTLVVSIITALKTSTVQTAQTDIKGKVEQVHQLTNSRLSHIENQLKDSESKLASAINSLREAEVTRVTLAQETSKQALVGKLAEVNLVLSKPTESEEIIKAEEKPIAVAVVQSTPVDVAVVSKVKR